MKYVVGFLFDLDCNVLLQLQRKDKPYTGGHLNGIGGKVEIGETPNGAMRREAREEADFVLPGDLRWQQFHYERHASGSELYFYTAQLEWVFAPGRFGLPDGCATNPPREELFIVSPREAMTDRAPYPQVPNLSYLLPMALHWLRLPSERYLEG